MKTNRSRYALLLPFVVFAGLLGVACGGAEGEEEPMLAEGEEEGAELAGTGVEEVRCNTTCQKMRRVMNYGTARGCTWKYNRSAARIEMDCPIASDRTVYNYAKSQLGVRAYRCTRYYYICMK